MGKLRQLPLTGGVGSVRQSYERLFESLKPMKEIAASMEDREYLLQGLLPPGGYLHLYGWQGTGKSRLAWQLADCVQRTGAPWMGFPVMRRGNVLWLELDMTPDENMDFYACAVEAGFPGEEIIAPDIVPEDFDAHKGECQEFLYTVAHQYTPALVVVDTLSDSFNAEMDNLNIQRAVRAFRRMFAECKSSFLFINHERAPSQLLQAKGQADINAELGGRELSRKASGVLRLQADQQSGGSITLDKIRSKRFWRQLPLLRIEGGFWRFDTHNLNAHACLSIWPDIEGISHEWARTLRSKEAIMQSIAEVTSLTLDDLNAAYQRLGGKDSRLPWIEWLRKS